MCINNEIRHAYCDMDHSNKWLAIQRRIHGNVNFTRNWQEYKQGFGDPSGDYWLGNDAIHHLTKNTCKLKFTMTYEDDNYNAIYESFSVGDESTNYRLSVNSFKDGGTAGDSFQFHHGV